MRIVYCTSEVAPFSKTGGLGDVAASLPQSLAGLGHDVTVISPWYRCVRTCFEARPESFDEVARASFRYLRTEVGGVEMIFVNADRLFDRSGLYLDSNGHDYPDNLERFTHLARAARAWVGSEGIGADVFHANDWQTALIPILEHAEGGDTRIPSVLTIHNAAYQGGFDASALAEIGLGPEYFTSEGLEYYGRLNLLKGGVVFADAITTVSPTYALEIQGEELGCGLDGVFRAHAGKLSGILNGIDDAYWDPATDPYIPATFSSGALAGKAECKAVLQEELGLPSRPEALVLGSIGRSDRQKGVELILDAFGHLSDLDLQLVILGSGDPSLEDAVRGLAAAEPRRVACRVGFDEALAHRIEAGADVFLMPSIYEPCGLNQMYSQRYGTVPIVRATGGLADTVVHAGQDQRSIGEGSGFRFAEPSAAALAQVIREAATVFFDHSEEWRSLTRRIMQIDNSWARRGRDYENLYRSICAGR